MSDLTSELYNEKQWHTYDVSEAQQHARQLILTWRQSTGGLSTDNHIAAALATVEKMSSVKNIARYMYNATCKGLSIRVRMEINRPQFPSRPKV